MIDEVHLLVYVAYIIRFKLCVLIEGSVHAVVLTTILPIINLIPGEIVVSVVFAVHVGSIFRELRGCVFEDDLSSKLGLA